MHTPSSHRGGQRRCSRSSHRPMLALGWLLATAAATLVSPAQAASIYLCKAYNGATFWSSAHCRQHDALIDRIESVPDGLPFDQQVVLAERSRAQAAGLYQAPGQGGTSSTTTTTTITTTNSSGGNTTTQTTVVNRGSPASPVNAPVQGPGKAEECKALDAHITQLDAMARQPQSGERQDWIRSEKQKARDRQFRLRC